MMITFPHDTYQESVKLYNEIENPIEKSILLLQMTCLLTEYRDSMAKDEKKPIISFLRDQTSTLQESKDPLAVYIAHVIKTKPYEKPHEMMEYLTANNDELGKALVRLTATDKASLVTSITHYLKTIGESKDTITAHKQFIFKQINAQALATTLNPSTDLAKAHAAPTTVGSLSSSLAGSSLTFFSSPGSTTSTPRSLSGRSRSSSISSRTTAHSPEPHDIDTDHDKLDAIFAAASQVAKIRNQCPCSVISILNKDEHKAILETIEPFLNHREDLLVSFVAHLCRSIINDENGLHSQVTAENIFGEIVAQEQLTETSLQRLKEAFAKNSKDFPWLNDSTRANYREQLGLIQVRSQYSPS